MTVPDLPTVPVMASDKRTKFVIAIDFGTTFSGIAWALEGCDDVEVIQEWPGKGNSTSQKVPTLLSYLENEFRWGWKVDDMKAAVRGVKLLLDRSKEIRYKPAIESEVIIEELKKTPVEICGEYLKAMVTHAKLILSRRGMGESILGTMDVQYILTVPAVWSDKAKDATMQAACQAGIPRADLFLLSEPEAAAVYAIRTIQPNSIAKGDCFIVCDAGGGTVDLITYQVSQTEPVRMEEVTEGTGAICGSVMLDELFQDFLIKKIGAQRYRDMPDSAKRIAMQRWQNYIKPYYSGPEDSEDFADAGEFIPVPGITDLSDINIHDGMLYIENKQIEEIFDPVVRNIQSLICDQITSAKNAGVPPKAIILVGGLGASEYPYKRLHSRFKGITIMQPLNAWSAVVRGAVYRGLEGNQVRNRKARCHYGITCSRAYDPCIHSEKDKIWCSWEEDWCAKRQMEWYIKKGESITEEKPIRLDFYRTVGIGEPENSFVFKDKLLFCSSNDAPRSLASSVSELCELKTDLRKIPKELFDRCKNSRGMEYYKISYDLVLTPTSASMLFDLEFNSISYGTVRAKYY